MSIVPRPGILRQGATAGALGAATVAAWFLAVDLIAGSAFRTPRILGEAFLSLFGPVVESPVEMIASYTILHFAAFTGLGILAAWLVDASRREPTVSAGLVVLTVAFQVLFYGVVEVVQEGSVLASLAWYQIGAANLAASISMGTYLWRTNPELKTSLEWALSGRES